MSRVYFNEINPYKAQWLRNLIEAGHLPRGSVVDERSIEDVTPADVAEFDRAHFFAGIGGWGLALERAGWPDEAGRVWTCGCPCQPFSAAGKRGGFADERHLWPALYHLVGECRPDVLLGEQVASRDGLAWLDLVQADMEAAGYAGGATDLCAAGFGAPHIRQRQWLTFERLADADGRQPRYEQVQRHDQHGQQSQDGSALREAGSRFGSTHTDGLADTSGARLQERPLATERPGALREEGHTAVEGSPVNGAWREVEWLECTDGYWRPTQPGLLPLAHGVSSRVGRVRAYGETISPAVAQAVAEAYLEHRGWVW